jgi:hypothetical protein
MADPSQEPPTPKVTFTERDGYLEALLPETDSVAVMLVAVRDVIRRCLDQKPSRLLVDFGEFRVAMSTWERFELGKMAAEVAMHVTRVAAVARPEIIDPQKIGVTVARNRGLMVDIFSDREAALAWLKQP